MTRRITVEGTTIQTITLGMPYSLTASVLEELLELLRHKIPSATRAVVFTAAYPEALLADVSEIQSLTSKEAVAFSELGQQVCAAFESLACPVIAAIDGTALGGGCELTLACDLVFATPTSQFGQIEVRGGILPGFGGTWRLARRVGDLKARQMLLTGQVLDAQSAFEIGLISAVVPSGLTQHARQTAEKLAANPPLAVRSLKQMILANRSLSVAESNALERLSFGLPV